MQDKHPKTSLLGTARVLPPSVVIRLQNAVHEVREARKEAARRRKQLIKREAEQRFDVLLEELRNEYPEYYRKPGEGIK